MKKTLYTIVLLFILFSNTANCQPGNNNTKQFMEDAFGRPLYLHTEYTTEGSPYYNVDYCSANIKVKQGKRYEGIKVKLNLLDNQVIYEAEDGKEMIATTPLESIEFIDCAEGTKNRILRNGFPAIDKQNGSNYYMILDDGKTKLLKYMQVTFSDTKNYGSASITRIFDQKDIYYMFVPSKGMTRLSRNRESITAALGDKRSAIDAYIKSQDIRLKSEDDMVKLFSYYNSL